MISKSFPFVTYVPKTQPFFISCENILKKAMWFKNWIYLAFCPEVTNAIICQMLL